MGFGQKDAHIDIANIRRGPTLCLFYPVNCKRTGQHIGQVVDAFRAQIDPEKKSPQAENDLS